MTVCGRCVNQYGYEHEKVSNIHVVATDRIAGTVYWFGLCDECGGWTDPCLTPTEAGARISKGWYMPNVVRCKDCEFFVRDKLGECCTLMDFERVGGMADGFCAWGERKEANYERQDD